MAKKSTTSTLPTLEETEFLKKLQDMEKDDKYHTESRYSGNTEKYPNNQISFSQWHMAHIKKFPNVDPNHYIANLQLMVQIR